MIVVDVLNDEAGRELLFNKYKIRKVPVLAKGDQYAFGQMLEPFVKLAGLSMPGAQGLTPEQLYRKYEMVFAAAQRYIAQFSEAQLDERAIAHRERIIRVLCYHIFRIGEAFLETWNGAEYWLKIADNDPPESIRTGADIVAYGRGVWQQYEQWWAGVEDKSLSRILKTYYGDVTAAKLFERVTWHSAQHCRQLIDVMGRMGITPDRPLTAEDLKGLPLPERVWE
jgi:DinB superfamily